MVPQRAPCRVAGYGVLVNDLVIRLATASDLEDVIEVLEDHSGRVRAAGSRWVESGGFRVADVDGAIVGVVVTERSFFGNEFVEMLRVARAARRRGAARALLGAVAEERRTEKVFTSTNLSNTPMQAVLRDLGWESVGIVYGLDEGDPELFYLAPPR